MPRVIVTDQVLDDFERIVRHLRSHDVSGAVERPRQIVEALDVLADNPRLGRPVAGAERELVIGVGSRGYVARYRYLDIMDVVLITSVRGQKEAGHADRD